MLELRAVDYRHEHAIVLDGVSFTVAPGEKVVLLGANGTGKSTLLKLIDGLIAPAAGTILYQGVRITPAALNKTSLGKKFRAEVALLFQNSDAMLFNPTVYDELAFGPRQLGLTDVDARVRHWADRVGVSRYMERPPFGLSGGEKQKVCLAALLVNEPRLLLLDEPTAGLDPRSTGWLVELLAGLPATVIVATHNLSLAAELGQRALVLDENHRLIHDGPIAPFLGDLKRLIAANLAHSHSHPHGGLTHRHFHTHDWQ